MGGEVIAAIIAAAIGIINLASGAINKIIAGSDGHINRFKLAAINLDIDKLKQELADIDDADEVMFAALAAQYNLSPEDLLDHFKAKSIKHLKKKLGVAPRGLFDEVADALARRSFAEEFMPLAAKFKIDLARIDYDKLFTHMQAGLYVLFYEQMHQYSNAGILLHWYFAIGDMQKYSELIKYYYPPIQDGFPPHELEYILRQYYPSDKYPHINFSSNKDRIEYAANNPQEWEKVIMDTYINAFAHLYNVQLRQEATLKDFADKQLKPAIKSLGLG